MEGYEGHAKNEDRPEAVDKNRLAHAARGRSGV
jgi:hypothetical protein